MFTLGGSTLKTIPFIVSDVGLCAITIPDLSMEPAASGLWQPENNRWTKSLLSCSGAMSARLNNAFWDDNKSVWTIFESVPAHMEVFDAGGPAAAVVATNLGSDHPTPDEHRTSVAQVNLDTTTEARGTVKDWEDLFQEVANGFTDLEVSSADPGSSIPSRYQIIDSHDLDISIQDQRNQQQEYGQQGDNPVWTISESTPVQVEIIDWVPPGQSEFVVNQDRIIEATGSPDDMEDLIQEDGIGFIGQEASSTGADNPGSSIPAHCHAPSTTVSIPYQITQQLKNDPEGVKSMWTTSEPIPVQMEVGTWAAPFQNSFFAEQDTVSDDLADLMREADISFNDQGVSSTGTDQSVAFSILDQFQPNEDDPDAAAQVFENQDEVLHTPNHTKVSFVDLSQFIGPSHQPFTEAVRQISPDFKFHQSELTSPLSFTPREAFTSSPMTLNVAEASRNSELINTVESSSDSGVSGSVSGEI